MNLYSVKPIDNDWMESAHPADQLQILVENMQTTFAAIHGQFAEFSKLIIQLKREELRMAVPMKRWKFDIRCPDGSVLHCLCDAPNWGFAKKHAEQVAADLGEGSTIENLIEENTKCT